MSNIVDDFLKDRLYNGIVENCREPLWETTRAISLYL